MIELIHELSNITWPAAFVLSACTLGAAMVAVAFIRER